MPNILRSKTAKAAVTALLLCVAPTYKLEVRAQRTMRGESLIEASAVSAPQFPAVSGVHVHYGRYMLSSYWKAGVSGVNYMSAADYYMNPGGSLHLAVQGLWMYRLLGTRDRRLSVYGGGGVFLGCELPGVWRNMGGRGFGEEDGILFLYGLQTGLEAEFFFARRVALTLSGSAPLNFTSPYGRLHGNASAGLRVNL